MLDVAVRIVPRRGAGEDRATTVPLADRLIVALADGAGGTSSGAAAADAVIAAVVAEPTRDPAELLETLDGDPDRLGLGETTAIVLAIAGDRITGASVGDSAAWLIDGSTITDITGDQQRKPLLGAGAILVPFASSLGGATLLVASDGLLKYARRDAILRAVAEPDLEVAADLLVAAARLPNGALQDDLSLVLVRA
ncbi:MAG: serine/threonine protein phosphatase [Kofleriaceae bacterium]